MYPRVVINRKKLYENSKVVVDIARKQGINVYAVTKVYCGIKELAEVSIKAGVVGIADSRVENLILMKDLDVPKMLLRLPMGSEADQVVKYADVSLNSELSTMRLLNEAAEGIGKKHGVILMIDLGDLREGILPEQVDEIVSEILKLKNLELEGIGVNLTCYGGVIPNPLNLGELSQISSDIETKYGIALKAVSGGNSSSLYLLERGDMPGRINQLRVGEAIVLGRETAYGDQIPGTHDDVFVLEAKIIELKEKSSIPRGEIGMDAFGNKPTFEDKGQMKRAIVAIGRQDVEPSGLVPFDEKIEIIGASSDHMILDLTHVTAGYSVGDVVKFRMDYGAMLRLFTSHYVDKVTE
ncbi:MAG: alanine/ornithine racemase family PLP-dependent enzyme [Clostridia bacterium]|nr:alanine/ornithine racemase family PLP-dependent enzyme [Clostridia bacterium]